MKRIAPIVLAVASAAMLASCGSDSKQLSQCPSAAILASTESLPYFRPNGPQDPSGVLFTAHADSVTTDCSPDPDAGEVTSTLEINFRASRAPTGEANQYSLPYFVAIIGPDGKLITKKLFSVNAAFAPGQAMVKFSDDIGSVVIHVPRSEHPYNYQILVGFQLTKTQLDYNRKMGRYAS